MVSVQLSAAHIDHPIDVLRFLLSAQANGEASALIILTDTFGGSIRAPGAIMGVAAETGHAGYVSNGCVDADLIFQARAAIAEKSVRTIRYGDGSPYADVKLPCGGSIDLLVIPLSIFDTTQLALQEALDCLSARTPVALSANRNGRIVVSSDGHEGTGWDGENFNTVWVPKIKLRIAGRGAEPLALARVAKGADLEVVVQTPDDALIDELESVGVDKIEQLVTPHHIPENKDDPWTAFVMMFHDHDWEIEILKDALASPSFYIGALGSTRTHEGRLSKLVSDGVSEVACARIHSPIGIVKAMRNASLLAVSALAEIVSVHAERAER